jgi:LEA14-like dessication related protein
MEFSGAPEESARLATMAAVSEVPSPAVCATRSAVAGAARGLRSAAAALLTCALATACVLVAACALLTACALHPHLEPPRLSVSDVTIQGGDLWQQHLRVRMHVQNPNDRAIAVKELDYTLEVAGAQLATGESAASFTVPALGETDFDMNVTTNLAGALLGLLARGPGTQEQGVAYHLTGKVTLASGWVRSIPFDERGSLTLQ